MRTMKAILLVAAMAVMATAAHAGTMTFGLNGDAAIPMSDFGDVMKVGYGGGVYGDYWIKDDYAFGVDINGDFFSAKDDILDAIKAASGPTYQDPSVKATLISFGVHGIWSPAMAGSSFSPWITYGAGMYHISGKIEDADPALDINGDSSDNKFGFNIGVGGDVKAGASMKFGAQVKYNYVLDGTTDSSGEDTAASYVTVGLHLTFLTAAATK